MKRTSTYHDKDYPSGCRCSICNYLFEEEDLMVWTSVTGDTWEVQCAKHP